VSLAGWRADPAHRLLLVSILASPEADIGPAVGRLASQVASTGTLAATAALHQVRPQLAARLPGIAPVDEAAAATRGHARLLTAELGRVLEVLGNAGVLAVPFKGPAFAAVAGSGVERREMTDLDLLVEPAQLERAANALGEIGFGSPLPAWSLASWLPRVANELMLVRRGDNLPIELHWALAQPWFPAPVGVADVMGRLAERNVAGIRVPWPAPEELLLVHVADGMKSCGFGLRWVSDVVDVLRTSPGLDWHRIRETARRNGGLASLRVAMAAVLGLVDEAAQFVGMEALAFEPPAGARALAREAIESKRLAAAAGSILDRLAADARVTRASGHFRWALQVSDRRLATARAVLAYLAGPAVQDLDSPAPDSSLRLRAFRRRLGGVLH
jgi:hypothetical protein